MHTYLIYLCVVSVPLVVTVMPGSIHHYMGTLASRVLCSGLHRHRHFSFGFSRFAVPRFGASVSGPLRNETPRFGPRQMGFSELDSLFPASLC